MTSRLSKPPEILAYSDMVERLERRTVDILQSAALAISDSDTAILVLFANAILLHIYMFMREMPLGISFLTTLSQRIRRVLSSLNVSGLENIQIMYPEMCLWLYVMGGIGGLATDERVYFAALARRLCVSMALRSEEKGSNVDVDDIERYLREWLWCEEYKGVSTAAFWAEIQVAGENLENAEAEEVIDEQRTDE